MDWKQKLETSVMIIILDTMFGEVNSILGNFKVKYDHVNKTLVTEIDDDECHLQRAFYWSIIKWGSCVSKSENNENVTNKS